MRVRAGDREREPENPDGMREGEGKRERPLGDSRDNLSERQPENLNTPGPLAMCVVMRD